MLHELLKSGFGLQEDYNCAERIVYGANEAYHLGLDKNALRLAAGFGGGMGFGDACGVLTGAIMVLGRLAVVQRAHESDTIKILSKRLHDRFMERFQQLDCGDLKGKYAVPGKGCWELLMAAGEILDDIVEEEGLLPAQA